ncbi:hypothetical protein QE177_06965 [Arsenophonus sp. aPb]|uniref:hypothetical protein n=1 Tax=Arsenophonus sp. aPb TaxID=3041619 RepID=UPI0024698EF6|nr:hypothetical protein [Arsenophonus sp. aPb]WGL99598.1 hypothetical protein QE177_06965 [Arsenophonus sp. aPb]
MKGWQLGIAITIILQIKECYAVTLFFSYPQAISCPFLAQQRGSDNFYPPLSNENHVFSQKTRFIPTLQANKKTTINSMSMKCYINYLINMKNQYKSPSNLTISNICNSVSDTVTKACLKQQKNNVNDKLKVNFITTNNTKKFYFNNLNQFFSSRELNRMKNFDAMEIEFYINYKINHKVSLGTRFLNEIDGINYKLTKFDFIAQWHF